MNTTENIAKVKAPKWMKLPEESIVNLTSEVSSWDSSGETDTSIATMSAVSDSKKPSSYVPELDDEIEIDIVKVHDDAWSTNEFIADSYHEIASSATRTTTIGYWEDIEHIQVPDWNARLLALKEISQQKQLRNVREKKAVRKHPWSIYVLVQ